MTLLIYLYSMSMFPLLLSNFHETCINILPLIINKACISYIYNYIQGHYRRGMVLEKMDNFEQAAGSYLLCLHLGGVDQPVLRLIYKVQLITGLSTCIYIYISIYPSGFRKTTSTVSLLYVIISYTRTASSDITDSTSDI